MNERVVITGLGVVSAIGVGREAFFDALASGATGVRAHATAAGDGVPLSAAIGDFGARKHFDPRVLRRLARLSQLALVASREALAQARGDASMDPGERRPSPWAPERIGVALGTGLGTLRETIDFMGGYVASGPDTASPLLFPTSVMNAAAGQMAIEMDLRGVNTTVNHRDASAIDALMLAADMLALGRADALLVGGVDEMSPPMLHAYRKLAPLSPERMRPYSRDRDGTVVGEGAAIYLVEREDDARRRGAHVLARLDGWAAGSEVRSRVGWNGSSARAVEVVRAALEDARILPSRVDYVCGAGCGLDIDAVEAHVVRQAIGTRPVPYGSVLGQTGDFMAAGAMRIATAIYALQRQALPGTVGAGEPDPDAPVPGLVRAPRAAAVSSVLVPSVAQGGADAAVVLGV